jgi:acyl-CoA synthetase (AMP-forming)/AMP-acid ligase II
MVEPASQEVPILEELRSFAAGKLAEYKMPRWAEAIEALPRNPTGKILKAALREQVSKDLL